MPIDILAVLGLRRLWPASARRKPSSRPQADRMRGNTLGRPGPTVARTRPETRHQGENAQQEGKQEGKPAMAVIPDDVQMPPPRAASPGLPPVDPVKAVGTVKPVRCGTPNRQGDGAEASRKRDTNPAQGMGIVAERADGGAPYPPGQGFFGLEVGRIVALGDNPDGEAGKVRNDDPFHFAHPGTKERLSLPGQMTDAIGNATRVEIAPAPSIPQDVTTTCGHSKEVARKESGVSPCAGDMVITDRDVSGTSNRARPQSLALDSRCEVGPPCASQPASQSRVPPRIADRPRVEEWSDDELMTLPEAAALFWPAGPITTNTLRTAGRDGALAITKVAGKFFTTPLAIRRMGVDEVGEVPAREGPATTETSPRTLFEARLKEVRRQGRDRKRRQREATKRSVAPSDAGAGR